MSDDRRTAKDLLLLSADFWLKEELVGEKK